MSEQMTISEFAKRVGVSIAGVRWWCDRGILKPRRIGRVRVFNGEELKAIEQWRQQRTRGEVRR